MCPPNAQCYVMCASVQLMTTQFKNKNEPDLFHTSQVKFSYIILSVKWTDKNQSNLGNITAMAGLFHYDMTFFWIHMEVIFGWIKNDNLASLPSKETIVIGCNFYLL